MQLAITAVDRAKTKFARVSEWGRHVEPGSILRYIGKREEEWDRSDPNSRLETDSVIFLSVPFLTLEPKSSASRAGNEHRPQTLLQSHYGHDVGSQREYSQAVQKMNITGSKKDAIHVNQLWCLLIGPSILITVSDKPAKEVRGKAIVPDSRSAGSRNPISIDLIDAAMRHHKIAIEPDYNYVDFLRYAVNLVSGDKSPASKYELLDEGGQVLTPARWIDLLSSSKSEQYTFTLQEKSQSGSESEASESEESEVAYQTQTRRSHSHSKSRSKSLSKHYQYIERPLSDRYAQPEDEYSRSTSHYSADHHRRSRERSPAASQVPSDFDVGPDDREFNPIYGRGDYELDRSRREKELDRSNGEQEPRSSRSRGRKDSESWPRGTSYWDDSDFEMTGTDHDLRRRESRKEFDRRAKLVNPPTEVRIEEDQIVVEHTGPAQKDSISQQARGTVSYQIPERADTRSTSQSGVDMSDEKTPTTSDWTRSENRARRRDSDLRQSATEISSASQGPEDRGVYRQAAESYSQRSTSPNAASQQEPDSVNEREKTIENVDVPTEKERSDKENVDIPGVSRQPTVESEPEESPALTKDKEVHPLREEAGTPGGQSKDAKVIQVTGDENSPVYGADSRRADALARKSDERAPPLASLDIREVIQPLRERPTRVRFGGTTEVPPDRHGSTSVSTVSRSLSRSSSMPIYSRTLHAALDAPSSKPAGTETAKPSAVPPKLAPTRSSTIDVNAPPVQIKPDFERLLDASRKKRKGQLIRLERRRQSSHTHHRESGPRSPRTHSFRNAKLPRQYSGRSSFSPSPQYRGKYLHVTSKLGMTSS
jgi:hypothetical protein